MMRFALDDSVKVSSGQSDVACGGLLWVISYVCLDDQVWHVMACSRRFRKGLMLTIRGSMCRFAPDDSVKLYLDDAG